MKGADLHMLSMGLEPVPWESFPEAISQTGETIFQAIEQRTCGEQEPGLVGRGYIGCSLTHCNHSVEDGQ
jgi:hypothetical protein